jgi:hypothetical protein
VRIADYFTPRHPSAEYLYDFGDDWQHTVVLEGIEPPEVGVAYPRCVAGEHACPPEDCGGPHGYRDFLRVISNPRHREHEAMLRWAGGRFDPKHFDPATVHFWDPKRRWQIAFEEGE